jgi:hypothetical protein
MSRKIKEKNIQVHFQCACGLNDVYPDMQTVKWKDFSKAGIIRRPDKKTNRHFLLQRIKNDECNFIGIKQDRNRHGK